ncbi:hypothetical protein LY76DRAFT_300510 [Colletotrichum caudatum]|nr:hypothetical protein LY76DRAFT_300510 [Colletotrichum caudatum]
MRKPRPSGSSPKLSRQAPSSLLPTAHRDRKDRLSVMENGNKARAIRHLLLISLSMQYYPVCSLGRINRWRGFAVLDGCGGSHESERGSILHQIHTLMGTRSTIRHRMTSCRRRKVLTEAFGPFQGLSLSMVGCARRGEGGPLKSAPPTPPCRHLERKEEAHTGTAFQSPKVVQEHVCAEKEEKGS